MSLFTTEQLTTGIHENLHILSSLVKSVALFRKYADKLIINPYLKSIMVSFQPNKNTLIYEA